MNGLMRAIGRAMTKSAPSALQMPFQNLRGGWFPIIREPFSGAFQRGIESRPETVIAFSPVQACITRIATDIGKMRFILKQKSAERGGIFTEVDGPSPFWPVLRKPNHYQTHIDFKESWLISKLRTGNTFVLKQRDGRGIVTALYVLDPMRCLPLISPDGSVFYRLSADNLSGLDQGTVVVPASEIIHDRMNCLFHPLIGLSPLFACALSAAVGIEINRNTGQFFMNGAKITGVIGVPGSIGTDEANKLSDDFNQGFRGENAHKIAVLSDGMKFTPLTMNSTDAQTEQLLKAAGVDVCTAFHMQPYRIGIGTPPSYDNIEALNQQYYNECLHSPIEKMEQALEEGLAIDQVVGKKLDIVLDIDCLLRMDKKTQMLTIGEGIKAGVVAPNEGRKQLDLPPVKGGDSPYLQQQNFSLEALAKRDKLPNPFVIDVPTRDPTPSSTGPAPVADPGAKTITAEIIDVEFTIVRELMAPLHVPPLALPAPVQKAA